MSRAPHIKLAGLLLVMSLSACSSFGPNPKNWYVKSVKGDTLTLYHDHKIVVVKCKGTKYKDSDKLNPSCGYLSQHVGGTREDGTGIEQVQLGDITYYTDRGGENGTHEVYEVLEETAQ
jgi:hypothetical protein